jgi:hypothetical protein
MSGRRHHLSSSNDSTNSSAHSDDSESGDSFSSSEDDLYDSPSESGAETESDDDGGERETDNISKAVAYPSETVEKTLIDDIEENGGLKKARLIEICENRPHVYGRSGSAARRGVQFKVNEWKSKTEKYFEKRSNYNIVSAEQRSQTKRQTLKTSIPKQKQPTSSTPNKSTKQTHTPPPPPPTIMDNRYRSSRRESGDSTHSTTLTSSSSLSSGKKNKYLGIECGMFVVIFQLSARLTTFPMFFSPTPCSFSDEIRTVDMERPENNGGLLFIQQFSGINQNDILHDGVAIRIVANLQDVQEDMYKMILVSQNAIMFCQPSLNLVFRSHYELFVEAAKKSQLYRKELEDHLAVAYNDVNETTDGNARRKVLRTILLFPTGTSLTNKVYSPHSRDGEIEFESLPISTLPDVFVEGTRPVKTFPQGTQVVVEWKLSYAEEKDRVVKVGKKSGSKGAAKLVKSLQSMGI